MRDDVAAGLLIIAVLLVIAVTSEGFGEILILAGVLGVLWMVADRLAAWYEKWRDAQGGADRRGD